MLQKVCIDEKNQNRILHYNLQWFAKDGEGGEKTEPATAKKLKDARDDAILGQRILPTYEGTMLSLIILSSAVLYEMIGPACAKLSLKLSGSIQSEPQHKPSHAITAHS